ncbi:hypothetical protein PA7_05320 [Pseudonocardia asaccharolytica DSM 44247 = NBRC 16224]|uniref:Uncharacterized protein n=1 Tax=Pseudonocardia asaccharolytica DSM 44247 = NBRC 16224 TaxID=1123024 RepID=A0A511CVU0_9PSEU|nr:hypothetical protein PA7_05320 [Pseudonocardia asaccharolytica DSM 44247 = NBRC 16224]
MISRPLAPCLGPLVHGEAFDRGLVISVGVRGQAVALGGLDGVSEDLGDGDDVLTVADQVRAGGVRFPQLRSLLGHIRPNFPEYYGDPRRSEPRGPG